MKFEDLKFVKYLDGVQALEPFGQYELSVIRHSSSYGGKQGLYEIGVFNWHKDMVSLPGITEDGDSVKGFLTEEEVSAILLKMKTITGPDRQ